MRRSTTGRKRRHSSHRGRKATTHRRRRRVSGGIGKIDFMAPIEAGAGAILARELNTLATKVWPSLPPVASGIGQVVLGVFLPKMIKQRWATNVGLGMAAFGVQVTAVNVGLITGMPGTKHISIGRGTAYLNPINGTPYLNPVNGIGANLPPSQNRYNKNFRDVV